MDSQELAQIIAAVLVLFGVLALPIIYYEKWAVIPEAIVTSIILVAVHVSAQKFAAYNLDLGVRHQIWTMRRFGWRPGQRFDFDVPAGILAPAFFSLYSVAFLSVANLWIYFLAILTYDARALKIRAARRFGNYSYVAMTEFHNALVGAAGIIAILLVAIISWSLGILYLGKIASYYAFFNMLPLSNLNGTQIFFGNRILFYILAVTVTIFAMIALTI
jgi:hypothetical protein